jgi:hypothetical protein
MTHFGFHAFSMPMNWILSLCLMNLLSGLFFVIMQWAVGRDQNAVFFGAYGFALFTKTIIVVIVFAYLRRQTHLSPQFISYYFLSYIFFSIASALAILPTKSKAK